MPDKNEEKINKPANEQEAWVGILYACIAADNEVSANEADTLITMLSAKIMFKDTDILKICHKITDIIAKTGSDGLIKLCCPLIKEENKPTLFSMALEIVLSDGLLELEERKIIEYLAVSLKIEKSLVLKIIEVMLIRNKGNIIRE